MCSRPPDRLDRLEPLSTWKFYCCQFILVFSFLVLADWKIFWCSGWLSNDPAAKHGHVQAVSGGSLHCTSLSSADVWVRHIGPHKQHLNRGKSTYWCMWLWYKSSFSYLPPPLTCSALVTTHPVPPHLLLFHLLQSAGRDINSWSWCGQKAAAPLSFPGQDAMGNTFWHFGYKVLQFLLPLGKPFYEWLSESPPDVLLQLAEHISFSPKNTSVCLTPLPQPMS